MKYPATVIIGAAILMFLFIPVMATPQVKPGPAIPGAVTEQEVRLFIYDYMKRFTDLDVERYMALFSERGVENRAFPYADIRQSYQKTIQRSHSIHFEINILTIQTCPGGAFVSGRYRIIQTLKTGRMRPIHGNIQWALIRENGDLKIREINYGTDR